MKVSPKDGAKLHVNPDGNVKLSGWIIDCEGGPVPSRQELTEAVIAWFAKNAVVIVPDIIDIQQQ